MHGRTAARGPVTVVVSAVVALLVLGTLGGLGPTPLGVLGTANPNGPPVSAVSVVGNPPAGPASPAPAAGPSLAWKNITSESTHTPPPRDSAGMVYDSTDRYVLLFGGEKTGIRFVYYNDTWEFSDGQWTNITSTPAPSPRFGFQLADDPVDHAVVLFGGRGAHGGQSFLNDTWEFRGGTWTNVTKAVAPPGRFWGSMSYDNATGTVLLFGGSEGNTPSTAYANDTWSFHAGVWTSLSPTKSPPVRDDQNQVDDLADHAVFLFGGLNSSGYLNDSWEYASGTWSQVSPGRGPDDRAGPGLAYDNATGTVVVYGGYPASTDYYATWLYHAGTWTSYALTPTPPAGTIWGQMTYDARDGYVVQFEGDGDYNSTWALTISPGSSGSPLTVTASVTPASGNVPLNVTYHATASGGTGPYSYSWEFGDGNTSSDGNTTHVYERLGSFEVNLTVDDSARHSFNESWTVTVQKTSPAASPPVALYVGVGVVVAALLILLALLFARRRRRQGAEPSRPPSQTPGPSPPPASPPP